MPDAAAKRHDSASRADLVLLREAALAASDQKSFSHYDTVKAVGRGPLLSRTTNLGHIFWCVGTLIPLEAAIAVFTSILPKFP